MFQGSGYLVVICKIQCNYVLLSKYYCNALLLQHNIQMDRIEDAIRDLENAISKCTTFAPSHVQKSFAGKDALIFVLLFCGFIKSS